MTGLSLSQYRRLFFLSIFLSAAVIFAAGPDIKSLRVKPSEVAVFQRVQASFSLGRSYDNPYDPGEVACWVELLGPGGRRLRMPAFWIEPRVPANDFTARHVFTSAGAEEYTPAGPGHWAARFVLTAPGRWRGYVVVHDAAGEARSGDFTLLCRPAPTHGFLRPAPNGQFLRFDDGSGFVPCGLCLAWARGRGDKDTYDYYFRRLQEAGCNTVRVWLCHWAWLEWTRGSKGALRAYEGVGRYNQDVAFNFDRLLELAEKHGLYVQLCLNNACWEFGRPDGKNDAYDSWGGNPYNKRKGGPCAKPADFWTDPEARRLYRNKLRYIVARWGYSTHVLAWELWNEQGSESDATANWHREMAAYLRQVDPYRHMVTTSTWISDARELPRIFASMDLVQLHYASDRFVRLARQAFAGKPIIVGEGPSAPASMARVAYTAPLSGAAGPPLTWHSGPSSPVERLDLYRVLTGAARFWQDFPAAAETVRPVQIASLTAVAPPDHRYAPVLLRPGYNTWLKKATQSEFVVPADGKVDTSGMSNRLYGSNADRAPYRNPPTFVVNYPVAGLFAVQVGESSGPAVLTLHVDGEERLRYAVPGSGRRSPPGEERWQAVKMEAGRHRVRIDNAGADWMTLSVVALTNYRDVAKYPPVTVLGLQAGEQMRIAVANDWAGLAPLLGSGEPPPLQVRLAVVAPSAAREGVLAWYDPTTGDVVKQERVQRRGKRLGLSLPDLRDMYVATLKPSRQ